MVSLAYTQSTYYVDVLMFYSPEALTGAGSEANLVSMFNSELEFANLANTHADQVGQFRLVGVYPSNRHDSGKLTIDRSWLEIAMLDKNSQVYQLRYKTGADLVGLVSERANDYAGWSGQSTPASIAAFTVLRKYALADHTMTHEMGHVIGFWHPNDTTIPCRGYIDPANRFATIMRANGPKRIPYWSSTVRTYNNMKIGNATHDVESCLSRALLNASNFQTPPYTDPNGCTWSITPTVVNASQPGGWWTVSITTENTCSWKVTNILPWITVSVTEGVGTGKSRLTLSANTGSARSGSIIVGPLTVIVNQAGK